MNSTTTFVARQYRLKKWAEQIRSCNNRSDSLSVKEWCEQNQITVANYYYRLRQVRKACLETIPACQESQSIVPVPNAWMASSDSGEYSLEITTGDFKIKVTDKTSPELLKMVM